jgi:hypothetical protein
MRVGILGSGLMGGKLGTIFARAGHEVVFSYSGSRKKLERLARDAHPVVLDWRADRPPVSWGSTSGIYIRLKERAFQKRIQRFQPPGGAGALRRIRAGVRGLFRVGAVSVVAVAHGLTAISTMPARFA